MTGTSDKVKGKMLKLIKNDFLASVRVIPLFFLIEVIALIVFRIGRAGMEKSADWGTKALVIGFMVSFFVAFLLIFVCFFFVVYDYKNSLFGQQGYLSFTLPVNSRQLLGSKLIVYGFWMLVSFADFILVVDILGRYANDSYGEMIDSASGLLSMFTDFPSKTQIIIYAVYFCIEFFALILSFIIMIYFAIAASYMRPFQKHNIIFSIIIFIATFIIYVLAISTLEKYLGVYLVMKTDGGFTFDFGDAVTEGTQLTLMPFIFMLVQDIAYFFLTADIMHKRVNIS